MSLFDKIEDIYTRHKSELDYLQQKRVKEALVGSDQRKEAVLNWLQAYIEKKPKCGCNSEAEFLDARTLEFACKDCSSVFSINLTDESCLRKLQEVSVEKARFASIQRISQKVLEAIYNLHQDPIRLAMDLNQLSSEPWDFNPFETKCPMCFDYFSVSFKSPILLSCNHCICVQCFTQTQKCYIGCKPGTYDFYPIDYNQIFEKCSECQVMFSKIESIIPYKLPCKHSCCRNCAEGMNTSIKCRVCNYDVKKFEELELNKNLLNRVQFFEIKCKNHKRQAKVFSFKEFTGHCLECSSEDPPFESSLNSIINKLGTLFEVYKKASVEIPEDIKSKFINYYYYPLETQLEVCKQLHSCYLEKNLLTYTLNRFLKILPNTENSTKGWKVESLPEVLNLTVSRNIFLIGFFLGKRIDKEGYFTEYLRIYQNSETIYEETQPCEFETLKKLNSRIELKGGVLYQVEIKLDPGIYQNGNPQTRNQIDPESRVKFEFFLNTTKESSGRNDIGGPILGIVYSFDPYSYIFSN